MYTRFCAPIIALTLIAGCGDDDAPGRSTGDAGTQDAGHSNNGGGGSGGSTGGGGGMDAAAVETVDSGTQPDAGAQADASSPVDGGSQSTCTAGQICFNLGSDAIAAQGGGYTLNDLTLGDYLFVKYELGLVQLSIDMFTTQTGELTAGSVRETGVARVYYFDEDGTQYMSSSGTVTLTAVQGGKVSGTFSATLEEFENDAFVSGGGELEISNGRFVDIAVPAI